MKIDFDGKFKEFEPKHLCSSFVATAIIGAGAIGAGASIYSANKAATAQSNAAATASNTALDQFNTVQNNLKPYMTAGNTATTDLTNLLPSLTAPVVMDQNALTQTPGYQFNLTQGLKSVQNSAAARGLGVSGAALKGASTFATGLADNTYQNQFSNAVTNQSNAYSRLAGLVNTGENAAAGTGAPAVTAGNTAANADIAAGNAQAAGSNAVGNSVSNVANNVAGYAIAKGLYGAGNAQVPANGDISGGNAEFPAPGLTSDDYA